jgi:hypothetical protein
MKPKEPTEVRVRDARRKVPSWAHDSAPLPGGGMSAAIPPATQQHEGPLRGRSMLPCWGEGTPEEAAQLLCNLEPPLFQVFDGQCGKPSCVYDTVPLRRTKP